MGMAPEEVRGHRAPKSVGIRRVRKAIAACALLGASITYVAAPPAGTASAATTSAPTAFSRHPRVGALILDYQQLWSHPVSYVRKLDLDSGRSTVVTDDIRDEDESHPTWSPNGRRIVFGCRGWWGLDEGDLERVPRLCLMRADGSGESVLLAKGVRFPTFGPDGKTVAYARGSDIYVRNIQSGRRRVVKVDAFPESLDWSPDGTRIVFTSEGLLREPTGTVSTDIYIIDLATRDIERVTDTMDVEEMDARWSPDGSKLLFMARPEALLKSEVATEIWTLDLATGVAARRIARRYDAMAPAWAPDGRGFAFVSWERKRPHYPYIEVRYHGGVRRYPFPHPEALVHSMDWHS